MKLSNPEVRIENSSACNAHCTICPREKLTRPRVIMLNEDFARLVRQAHDLGAKIIAIYGYGEPLLDPGLATKIKLCTDLGLETFITTNASLLNSDLSHHILNAGLTQIRFSMHGFDRKSYEAVHRGLSYFKVRSNISEFLNINKHRHKRAVTMLTTIPSDDVSLDEIIDAWESDVDYLEIWKPHNWAGGRDFRTIVRKKKTCGRPWHGPLQINADGKVMVCCFDFNAEMIVGDTHKQDLRSIIIGKEFDKIRRAHREGDLTGLPCETCDQLNEYKESPLLYSNRDASRAINRSSTNKFRIGG